MKTRRLAALLGTVLTTSGLALLAAPTDAATYARTSTTTMTVPSNATASSPLATTLNVYGTGTTVADVNVVLTGLSHTNPDDLDIELVHSFSLGSPKAVALMSDVCGTTALTTVDLTLDDEAATALPDSTACSSGSWRPNNVGGGDAFDVPVSGASLAAFDGDPATGQWSLYVRDDDASGDGGSLAGWTVQITTAADVAIAVPGPQSTNGSGAAGPYPFSIPVSGKAGPVADVNLTLPGLTHTDPDELDVLLASPDGRSVVVMSDGCGNDAANVTLTFDDQAAADLPSASGTCASGSYRPTNFGAIDAFPAPASVGQLGTSMAHFNGAPANGTWLLYIVDDGVSYDTGWLLGAPTLTITTDDKAPDTKIKKKPHTSTATTAKLKFTSSEPGSTFECKVDHKKFKPCGAKLTLKHLKVGKHKIRVRATDAAGNTDPSPAKATWRVLRRR